MRANRKNRLLSRTQPSDENGKLQWNAMGSRVTMAEIGMRWMKRLIPGCARGALRTSYLLITITMVASSHPQLAAQQVTSEATPSAALPDGPDAARYPEAVVLPQVEKTETVVMESDMQSKTGTRYVLDGNVIITYGNRRVEADHIEYDSATSELEATGHLKTTGGANDESISASHGTINLNKQTGRFYDVSGSVGLKSKGHKVVYTNGRPFLFTGRVVVKKGPKEYEVYDGTVTSCQLEHPDWLLYAGKFVMDGDKASAHNSVFHLMNIPLLYMPYVTHPVNAEGRQSGLMTPVIGESSTKGLILGEEFYFAINRSTDLTVGVEYFSLRGWSQMAAFHYRGLGNDFVTARYSGLLDRGYVTGGQYVNQGGQDVTFSGRHDLSAQTRVVGNMEYLSSYPYREAFTENFNQAVSTDILSFVYGTHEADGFASDVRADRYQGLKRVAVPATPTTPAIPAQEVRIFHAPALEINSTDHAVGGSRLLWNVESSAAGLKRVQPDFASGGVTERFDVHPEIAYPLTLGGWRVFPSLGVRGTLYSRSLKKPSSAEMPSVENTGGLTRSDVEAQVDLRPPVIERTFDSKFVEKLFGHDVRHTIEPELKYRYVSGVGNFLKVLRFDDVDIVSNTNEFQYGVTQRLFLRPAKGKGKAKGKPCKAKDADADESEDDDSSASSSGCNGREWISWRLTQKYFFNKDFGGAVVDGRRNIFDTTLNLSGVAFLTEAREISPLISRLRVRTSDKMDVEWDFDLDTGAKKFTSNNVLVDVHEGNTFAGLSYARLNAPGRSYTQGTASAISNFSQLRLLAGFGSPTKQGLGVAANVGLDLNLGSMQYGALQTSYNWDCCGLSVEYRKYELGSVRNENAYRFNFTLANIGAAGNLRRAERLF